MVGPADAELILLEVAHPAWVVAGVRAKHADVDLVPNVPCEIELIGRLADANTR